MKYYRAITVIAILCNTLNSSNSFIQINECAFGVFLAIPKHYILCSIVWCTFVGLISLKYTIVISIILRKDRGVETKYIYLS